MIYRAKARAAKSSQKQGVVLLLCRRRKLHPPARARVRGLELQMQLLMIKRRAIALCVQLPPCALRSGGGGKGVDGGQTPFGALERALQRSQVGHEAGAAWASLASSVSCIAASVAAQAAFEAAWVVACARASLAATLAATRATISAICASSYSILDPLERAASTDSLATTREQQDSSA